VRERGSRVDVVQVERIEIELDRLDGCARLLAIGEDGCIQRVERVYAVTEQALRNRGAASADAGVRAGGG
jgi:hypothetical protein